MSVSLTDLAIHNLVGYVAGWRVTRNADCFTDNFGPERHARCRFPFKFNGELREVAFANLHGLKKCIDKGVVT